MKVNLKFAAYAGKRLFPAGPTDDWPDDTPLPSTAEKIDSIPEPEPEVPDEEPDTLSQLQKKGSPKK